MSLQVQHVYPAQVQYVEGGDAVYANGAMYVSPVGPGTPQILDSSVLYGARVESCPQGHVPPCPEI